MLLLFFLFFGYFANANANENLRFSIGVDIFQSYYTNEILNRNEPAIQNPFNSIRRISTGMTYKPFEKSYILIGVSTNRFVNISETYTSISSLEITQKIQADSVRISHPISENLIPFFVISDITSTTSIKNVLKETTKNSIMYGLGLTYFAYKHHTVSWTYFFANSDFGTSSSFGTSYNYIF